MSHNSLHPASTMQPPRILPALHILDRTLPWHHSSIRISFHGSSICTTNNFTCPGNFNLKDASWVAVLMNLSTIQRPGRLLLALGQHGSQIITRRLRLQTFKAPIHRKMKPSHRRRHCRTAAQAPVNRRIIYQTIKGGQHTPKDNFQNESTIPNAKFSMILDFEAHMIHYPASMAHVRSLDPRIHSSTATNDTARTTHNVMVRTPTTMGPIRARSVISPDIKDILVPVHDLT